MQSTDLELCPLFYPLLGSKNWERSVAPGPPSVMSNWEDETCTYEQGKNTDSENGGLRVDLNATRDVPGLEKGQGIPGKNKNKTELTKPWKEIKPGAGSRAS